jgi:hypothetical protein
VTIKQVFPNGVDVDTKNDIRVMRFAFVIEPAAMLAAGAVFLFLWLLGNHFACMAK